MSQETERTTAATPLQPAQANCQYAYFNELLIEANLVLS